MGEEVDHNRPLGNSYSEKTHLNMERQTCIHLLGPNASCVGHITPSLTWRVTLNDRMVVHLKRGITTAAREAHHVVFAVVYHDGRLIYSDVISPDIEDDTNFSLILQVGKQKRMLLTT